MEVFICNVSFIATPASVAAAIAPVLHGSGFEKYNKGGRLVNFHVSLKPSAKGRHSGPRGRNGGIGSLTLPSVELGRRFLYEYGGRQPRRLIHASGRQLTFDLSKRLVSASIVEQIRRLPFIDPIALQRKEDVVEMLSEQAIPVKDVQFGWHCRDDVFSIECELEGRICFGTSILSLDIDRREIRIRFNFEGPSNPDHYVVIHFNQINTLSAITNSGRLIVYVLLFSPCLFERDLPLDSDSDGKDRRGPTRRRLSQLGFGDHAHYAPYTSYSVRVVGRDDDLQKFRRVCDLAGLQKPDDYDYPVEYRRLFTPDAKAVIDRWITTLQDFQVAYQVMSLLGDGSIDMIEAIKLIPRISKLVAEKGSGKAITYLRRFHAEVRTLWSQNQDSGFESVDDCFEKVMRGGSSFKNPLGEGTSPDGFDCHHVTITPTSTLLEGPLPEMSNRIIRKYFNHQEFFLKVSFTDEDKLEFRFDRELDNAIFVRDRVGKFLHKGFVVAGKHFEFLGYSQSALKEHAVWFVTPFVDSITGEKVTARSIIKSIGKFHGLSHDPHLMYCPARYGARISQAFTTTNASVLMEADEILEVADIKRNGHCFTDGIGVMSLDLAQVIWEQMPIWRQRNRVQPKAFQIRLMGSKGVLSVDHKLSDRTVFLRPSMIKFEAPHSREIEVANAFDKPTPMFLNRPLIMLLEGLGVPAQVFEDLQQEAVADITKSTQSTKGFARLLDAYGLGTSFRLSSIYHRMANLGLSLDGAFHLNIVDFAKNHIMREIKHKARIPVRGWNLVGVADVHGYLEEGEVFVCVHYPATTPFYLEGPVLVSRSPTIHPGDIQVVRAIGKPPPGSPFEIEPLDNTVVFSTRGARPLPSYLGGGDLDGDTYNVTDFLPLHPPHCATPGLYEPAIRKEVDHLSTMSDVANFVVDYINSDLIGVVASTWLMIADQCGDPLPGIFDKDCLVLAQLHNDAVDFPKSGRPVNQSEIPWLKFNAKPDWSAPETINPGPNYYTSTMAIGKLFRAIELIALPDSAVKPGIEKRDKEEDFEVLEIEAMMAHVSINDEVHGVLRHKVNEYIEVDDIDFEHRSMAIELFKTYSSELKYIAMTHTLSTHKMSRLSEEEAVVGTIVAKTAQQRRRKDMTSKLRDQTANLVRSVRVELVGGEPDDEQDEVDIVSHYERMRRGWAAYEVGVIWNSERPGNNAFAAKSFQLIGMGLLFDAIKGIDEDDRKVGSGSAYWKAQR